MNEYNFLEARDYLVFISQDVTKKLINDNETKLTDSERMAYGYIYEKLSGRFDIAQEIAKRGDNRNPAMVRWMTTLAIYYIYQCVPDLEIPERVIDNYKDTINEIQRVASGKDNSTLTPVKVDGKTRTKSQFYYNAKRSHNPFN